MPYTRPLLSSGLDQKFNLFREEIRLVHARLKNELNFFFVLYPIFNF